MPIYEYQCQSCEHEFEALQKMSDPLLTECPACHDQALRKKVSAAAFRLKGGGWYETDFKTGKKKNVAGEKSGDASSGGDKAGKESKSGSESKTGSSSPASAT
ncbi:zinc ribbon domain-containing protein [Proteobacteria bacterium 005FR1]|nr:zinc ribbon domain-containing protein [Proteobacteria bacterium 005FR1]